MRAILIFALKLWGTKCHKTVSTDHNFSREKRAKVESNWGSSAFQPNALLLGQTSSQHVRHFCWCCFTSTETIRTIRDGEPRTATSTFTQLLSSECDTEVQNPIHMQYLQLFSRCSDQSMKSSIYCCFPGVLVKAQNPVFTAVFRVFWSKHEIQYLLLFSRCYGQSTKSSIYCCFPGVPVTAWNPVSTAVFQVFGQSMKSSIYSCFPGVWSKHEIQYEQPFSRCSGQSMKSSIYCCFPGALVTAWNPVSTAVFQVFGQSMKSSIYSCFPGVWSKHEIQYEQPFSRCSGQSTKSSIYICFPGVLVKSMTSVNTAPIFLGFAGGKANSGLVFAPSVSSAFSCCDQSMTSWCSILRNLCHTLKCLSVHIISHRSHVLRCFTLTCLLLPLLCWTVNLFFNCGISATQKTRFHFMHLLWVIKFFFVVLY